MRAAGRAIHALIAFATSSALAVTAFAQDAPRDLPTTEASPGANSPGTGRERSTPAPASQPAVGPPARASSAPTPAFEPRPRWGHQGQITLRIASAFGYRFALRYGNGTPCNASGSPVCYGFLPVMFDAALGFGLAETLELEGRLRVGSPDWNRALPLQAGLGLRVYSGAESRLKFAMGLAALVDFTDAGDAGPGNYGIDVLARLEPAIHYDVGRYFAFYVQCGASFGFVRTFSFSGDVGLGLQARFP